MVENPFSRLYILKILDGILDAGDRIINPFEGFFGVFISLRALEILRDIVQGTFLISLNPLQILKRLAEIPDDAGHLRFSLLIHASFFLSSLAFSFFPQETLFAAPRSSSFVGLM